MQDSDIENILGILHPFRKNGADSVAYRPTDGGFIVQAFHTTRKKEIAIDLRCQWDENYDTVICRFVAGSNTSEPFEMGVKDYMLLQGKMLDFIRTL